MKPVLMLTIPGLLDAEAQATTPVTIAAPVRFVAPIQALHNGCPLCGGHTEQDECTDGLYRRICTYSEHHDTGFAECAWEGVVLAASRDAYMENREREFNAHLMSKYGTTDPAQIDAKMEAASARWTERLKRAAMLLDNPRGASLTA